MNVSAKQKNIICWHKDSGNLNKFDGVKVFLSELDKGFLGTGVAIIMNTSLAHYVCKISEVFGQLLSVKLLFKNKLSVSILGLYAGVSLAVYFSQANDVNFVIAKTCLDLGLVNSLGRSSFSMAKIIDFLFVSANLVNAVVDCVVSVFISVGLGRLLDVQLNSLHKQDNKNCWKFNFKGADNNRWKNFKNATLANAEMFFNKFTVTVKFSDLDAIKKWFKNFDSVFTKVFSKIHKLELLVSKIVKAFHKGDFGGFVFLMKCWNSLNSIKASIVQDLINSNATSSHVYSALSGIRKFYCAFKLAKFLATKEMNIRAAINKRIKSFETNKDHTIRSVLEHPFHKVVLDHLVVENELILKPNLVKFKMYIIMEVFSGVMRSVELNKLFDVIFNLLDDKVIGLSSITNKLWKHCDKSILNMLLVEAWVSMILKPYKWEGVLTNTHPIALIETAFLKGTTTQSPIFAVRSVVEDILVRIKMCGKFIRFFSSIHKNCTNRVIKDFGLTNNYCVHDDLDQEEVFFLSCGMYFMILYYAKLRDRKACMVIVGSSQIATQYILNVASKFFRINNIFINNDKTVVILINSRVNALSLSISGLLISIAKKSESYQYLGIFHSTKGLSKLSLVKTNLNVCFFTNLVLKKAVLDKQFLYLVLAVFHSIVSYRIQFSFVLISTCNNSLPFLLWFKSFFQVQFESKILCWCPVHSLSSPVHICVSSSNNFLAGMVRIFLDCNLSLGGSLANFFWFHDGVSMSAVLNESQFLRFFSFLQQYGVVFHWKRLNLCGSVPEWFKLSVVFLDGKGFSFICSSVLDKVCFLNIFESSDFVSVCDRLLQVSADSLSVYTDGSLSNLSTVGYRAGTAAFFEDIDLGLGISMSGLMSSTLAELQAIALALECVLLLSFVKLFSDSQFALDACKSELGLACPNFHNQCWVKCHYIVNVIYSKNLKISWHKIKDHSGISKNEHADIIAGDASLSG
ncbi:hypothetical protein G9A89_023931 [Geosiphon pyriformis]|nr:hypothetical protein G9A89_023931 [Geosiphon pyriformis]